MNHYNERHANPDGRTYYCNEHPFLPAVAMCIGCGRFLCSRCITLVGNRNYCHDCAQRAILVPRPPFYPTRPFQENREPAQLPFPHATWNYREALGIFFGAATIAFVLSLILRVTLPASLSSLEETIVFVFVSSVLLYSFLLVGIFFSVKRTHHKPLSVLGISREIVSKDLLFGLGLGVPLFLGALVAGYLSQLFIKPTKTDIIVESVSKISSGSIPGWAVFLLVITLVVLAPICEEIFFRGYAYPIMRNKMPPGTAILLNGVIFAAAHFEIAGFIPRMLLGYGLAYMYEKNRTLTSPIIGHALYNGLLLLLVGLINV